MGAVSRSQLIGGLAILVLVGTGVWMFSRRDDAAPTPAPAVSKASPAAAPSAAEPGDDVKDAPPPDGSHAVVQAKLDYRQKVEQIRRVRLELRKQEAAEAAARADRPPVDEATVVAELRAQFLPLLLDCAAESASFATSNPKVVLEFHLIGEPDIGAVVDEVELVTGDEEQADLTTCMTESLYAVKVEPPVASLDLTSTIKFEIAAPLAEDEG